MSYISISEAAKILKVSIKTMHRWDEDNTFPALREEVSQARIYDMAVVLDYKNWREARGREKAHLRKLGPIRQKIEKYLVTQPLAPGEKTKVFDGQEMGKAYKALDEWNERNRELREYSMKFFDVVKAIDKIRRAKQNQNNEKA